MRYKFIDYCDYLFNIGRVSLTTKAPIAGDSSEKKSPGVYFILMVVFVVLLVVTILACAVIIIVLYRKSRKTANEITRPDQDAVELDAEVPQ